MAQRAEETARAAINRGVTAFKGARYAEAASEFEQAVRLEPANASARLYLGSAYMSQWLPGVDTPANSDLANRAEAAFRSALDLDPRDKVAVASLASLAFKSLQESPSDSGPS